MNRRQFLRGGLVLAAAPAIVRAASLMPVRALPAVPILDEVGVMPFFANGEMLDQIAFLYGIRRRDLAPAETDWSLRERVIAAIRHPPGEPWLAS